MKCKICSKEIIGKKRKIYCSNECSYKANQIKLQSERMIYPCELCGFDKIVEAHHVIRRIDYGSDDFENLIFLCPNHHKMAHNVKYSDEILKLILEKTGKIGKKLSEAEILEVNKMTYSHTLKGRVS